MSRTRHPFQGTVCPNCGQDLYCNFNFVVHSSKLGTAISEEKRNRWPEDPPTLSNDITDFVNSFGNLGLLEALDRKVGQKKLEMRHEAVRSGTYDSFGDIVETSRFLCPSCHTSIQLTVSFRILEAVKFHTEGISDNKQKGLNPQEIEVIETCQQNGVFKAFTDAVDFQFGNLPGKPKNLERFFLNFLRLSQKTSVPYELKRELHQKFPDCAFVLWDAQFVSAITINDAIYQFVPASVLKKISAQEITGSRRTLGRYVETYPDELSAWVKTKYGHVPLENKVFLGALRQRSYGSLSNT